MQLPQNFQNDMTNLFERFLPGGEIHDFWESFRAPACQGFRANRLKIAPPDLAELLGSSLQRPSSSFDPVDWCVDGFHLPAAIRLGKLSFHAAGLYYLQEPSAMLPAAILAARPGERVLDLCAAPGGKSARIAADLDSQGLLWANDIAAKRTRALRHNLERIGCRNAVISCGRPQDLLQTLGSQFDAILVDAPCSGSGMFRRDPASLAAYRDYGPEKSAKLQQTLLRQAWGMLKPGGRLVYSTCTFTLSENEGNIADFLKEHADAHLLPIAKTAGLSPGLALTSNMHHTVRIWPHRARGEGHFCALLQKQGTLLPTNDDTLPCEILPPQIKVALAQFCDRNLSDHGRAKVKDWQTKGTWRFQQQRLHLVTAPPQLDGSFRLIGTGLDVGQIKMKGRQEAVFIPSHAFLLALNGQDLKYGLTLPHDHELIHRFLRGETLSIPLADFDPAQADYVGLSLQGAGEAYGLGWLKPMQSPLYKNLYPRGWCPTLAL